MNATAQSQLDIGALMQAFEANDVEKVLQFYSDDLEHVEIDSGAPPKSPRTSDFQHLGNALRGAAQAGIKLRMPVFGSARSRTWPRMLAQKPSLRSCGDTNRAWLEFDAV